MTWFHAVGGLYNIEERWVGIDLANSFFKDKDITDSILCHEYVHSVIGHSDFTQGTQTIYQSIGQFQGYTEAQQNELKDILYKAQWFVQEGIATAAQINMLALRIGKDKAKKWAKENLHPDYYTAWKEFEFLLDVPKHQRDSFLSYIKDLALETNFRRRVAEEDLLESPEKLKQHLAMLQNNPDERLKIMVAKVRAKRWILNKSVDKMAELCGVDYWRPCTTQDIANFMNYVVGKTGQAGTFTSEQVGEPVPEEEKVQATMDSMLVTNLNLNLAENGEFLWHLDDFVFYKDVYSIIFVNLPSDDLPNVDIFEQVSGTKAELALVGITKTGEKYLTLCKLTEAEALFNNELKPITKIVKWGGYHIGETNYIWTKVTPPPDLVLYNRPQDMTPYAKHYFEKFKQPMSYYRIRSHLEGAIEMVFLEEPESHVLHIANNYGDKRIIDSLEQMHKDGSIKNEKNEIDQIKPIKEHVNNYFHLLNIGLGLDWVETMIQGTPVRRA